MNQIDLNSLGIPAPIPFSVQLRELRRRHFGKQLTLSLCVECTEAAVSFWESGSRLPKFRTLERLTAALRASGAADVEIDALWSAWRRGVGQYASSRHTH